MPFFRLYFITHKAIFYKCSKATRFSEAFTYENWELQGSWESWIRTFIWSFIASTVKHTFPRMECLWTTIDQSNGINVYIYKIVATYKRLGSSNLDGCPMALSGKEATKQADNMPRMRSWLGNVQIRQRRYFWVYFFWIIGFCRILPMKIFGLPLLQNLEVA